jgi:hypothetical protein
MKRRFITFTGLFLATAALSIIAAGSCGPWIAALVMIAGVCIMTDYAEAKK